MSTTTAADLLARAHQLAIVLRDSHEPTSLAQWEQFDVTLHRALHETVGADASYLPRRDPQYFTVLSAIRGYPTPLRPPADIPLTPVQAGRLLDLSRRAVHKQVRRGELPAVHDGDVVVLHARDLDRRPDITAADATDPHPLARLSVTLGALADRLHHARDTGEAVLTAPGEAATTARQLLAIGLVAAGHTLAVAPYAQADRPMLIAQFTERVLDTLAGATTQPGSLDRLRSIAPNPDPADLGDRLEAALDTWAGAARADLARAVPSTETCRTLANQAVHLYATAHKLLTATPPDRFDPDSQAAAALTAAARTARASDPLWAGVTTLARPSLEYATASRDLFTVLNDVTAQLDHGATKDLDTHRALADLTQATTTMADLMAQTRTLPERLHRSRLLHSPKATRPTVADLNNRRRMTTRPATPEHVADLAKTWRAAGITARASATQLEDALRRHPDHALRPLTPIERTL